MWSKKNLSFFFFEERYQGQERNDKVQLHFCLLTGLENKKKNKKRADHLELCWSCQAAGSNTCTKSYYPINNHSS